MPQVVTIRRGPSGIDLLGQGIQQSVDRYLQSGMQMAQQADANARAMASLGMTSAQLQRQAREDAKVAKKEQALKAFGEEAQALGGLNSPDAEKLLMRYMADMPDMATGMLGQIQQRRNLERQIAAQEKAEARSWAAQNRADKRLEMEMTWRKEQMNKPQLIQSTDQYGRPAYMQYFPDGRIIPLQTPGQLQGQTTAIQAMPGMQAEPVPQPAPAQGVLQEEPGMPTPAPAPQAQPMDTGRPAGQQAVIEKFGLMPQAQTQPQAQDQRKQESTQLQIGGTYDASGNPVSVPPGIPWSSPKEITLGNQKYSVQYNEKAGLFKILGFSAPSATERKAEQELKKSELRETQTKKYANIVLEDIDRALEKSGFFTTGPIGGIASKIPGTDAYDMNALLTTIKSNLGFDRLQAMREASPTGGALGSVSNFEVENLQATMGNLMQSQSREQFEHNLKRLRQQYIEVVHGPGAAMQQPAQSGGGNVIRYDAQGRRVQ